MFNAYKCQLKFLQDSMFIRFSCIYFYSFVWRIFSIFCNTLSTKRQTNISLWCLINLYEFVGFLCFIWKCLNVCKPHHSHNIMIVIVIMHSCLLVLGYEKTKCSGIYSNQCVKLYSHILHTSIHSLTYSLAHP